MEKCSWNFVDWLALILVLVGALNWGLIGAFHFNLVEFLFAKYAMIEKIVYILVGLAAIYKVFRIATKCKSN